MTFRVVEDSRLKRSIYCEGEDRPRWIARRAIDGAKPWIVYTWDCRVALIGQHPSPGLSWRAVLGWLTFATSPDSPIFFERKDGQTPEDAWSRYPIAADLS